MGRRWRRDEGGVRVVVWLSHRMIGGCRVPRLLRVAGLVQGGAMSLLAFVATVAVAASDCGAVRITLGPVPSAQ